MRGLLGFFDRLFPPATLGQKGERAAARHLQRNGYRILARNLRSRLGEIDLLAEHRRSAVVAVVEVKTMAHDHPRPEDHVNRAKQRKLSALAGQLVRRYKLHNRLIRFDVIAVVWPEGARQPTRLTHIENAFESTL